MSTAHDPYDDPAALVASLDADDARRERMTEFHRRCLGWGADPAALVASHAEIAEKVAARISGPLSRVAYVRWHKETGEDIHTELCVLGGLA